MKGPCDGPSIDLNDLIGCFVQVQCEYFVSCEGFNGTTQECIDLLTPDTSSSLERTVDSVNAGRIVYDGNNAYDCLQSLIDSLGTCMGDPDNNAACDATFQGQVSPGAACFDSEECSVDGSQCYDSNCGDIQCCAATCVSPQGIGDDCSSSFCAPDDHCVGDATGARTCQSGSAGSACTQQYDCDDDHYCGSAGACIADKTDGQACTDDSECLAPALCNGDDLTAGSGQCAKANAVGDACDSYCLGNLYCKTDNPGVDSGTCTAQPAIGEPCGYSDAYCRDGYCDTNQALPVCVPLRGGGETCNDVASCDQDHFCNTNGICQSRGTDGASCGSSSECQPPLFCTNEITAGAPGSCAPPLADGMTCKYDSHCESRECHDDPNNMGAKICEAYTSCQ